MIFEIVDSTSGPLETHTSKNTKFSPLRGLAPFLPPASWGGIQEQYFMKKNFTNDSWLSRILSIENVTLNSSK